MRNNTMKVTAQAIRVLVAGAAIIAAAGLVGATPAFAQTKQTNSAKLAKPLKEAHDDLNAKKYADAIGKLPEADGTARKTSWVVCGGVEGLPDAPSAARGLPISSSCLFPMRRSGA